MRRDALRISLTLLLLGFPALAGAQVAGTVKPAGREPSLTIGGLVQAQADFGDRGDARFTNDSDRYYLRRARLNASGRFLEEFDFRVELDLAGSLGNTAGLRAQLTDGYLTWNRYPAASVRVGQFKTPFGFEQLFGDPRLITLERSLVNDRLTLSRQLGVQVAGELFEKRLSYAVGNFNGNGANNNFNDDDGFLTAGRLAGTPWQGKLFGQQASWSIGGNAFSTDDANVAQSSEFGFDSTPATADRDNIFAGERTGSGFDSQLQIGPFDLWVEHLQVEWEPTSGRPRAEIESEGWYVQASSTVVPNRFQVVLKVEDFDPRKDNANDSTRTTTAGVNWYLKGHDLKLMLDVLRVEVDRLDDQTKALARFQVIF